VWGGYGMQVFAAPVIGWPDGLGWKKFNTILQPSLRFIIADGIDYGILGYIIYDYWSPDYRHTLGANLLFMDGHVEWWRHNLPVPMALPW